ncbi:CrcB-like protein-domain-containing protein [Schizophyllum amplum]|uniref:CrcB-like protein-domain-containing protein n=1 Tax=Schizophyllum amplum TaxID=97359 RepID=A0A550CSI5_9AGAR|nr:CrcB-like protein-domain-containing protein [Auriculariopsis ampla]
MSSEPRDESTRTAANKEQHTYSNGNTQRRLSRDDDEVAELSDEESVGTIDRPPSEHEKLPPAKVYGPYSIHVICLLIPGSILGVLARLGLQALAKYDGQSIFPLAYPQALGCFVMGLALGLKEPIGEFYGPIYTGITTGFCGSLTTFSSWQTDVFDSWTNAYDHQRGGFYDFMDGLCKTVFTLVLSLGSATFGRHVATNVKRHVPTLAPPRMIPRYTIDVLCITMYAVTLAPFFVLSTPIRHQATAALLFAFPGTLTRYLLSVFLNPLTPYFPLGTFMANMAGTTLLGTFHVLQSVPGGSVSSTSCAILQGLGDGFCGCLTTVSTFAVEVLGLRMRHAVRYVLLSWVAAQLLLLLVLGPSYWHAGVHKTATCTS